MVTRVDWKARVREKLGGTIKGGPGDRVTEGFRDDTFGIGLEAYNSPWEEGGEGLSGAEVEAKSQVMYGKLEELLSWIRLSIVEHQRRLDEVHVLLAQWEEEVEQIKKGN